MRPDEYTEYGFHSAGESHMHARLVPLILALAGELTPGARVLDIGCGNGFVCGEFLKRGCTVVGVDPSERGIALAREAHPRGRFEVLPVADGLLRVLGEDPFDLVVSAEVVEHLYAPRVLARASFHALKAGGRLIVTTPYHGYLKNLALGLLGRWDAHADPLWDGGHIKLWSRRTLGRLLTEAGFVNLRFRGAGRMPGLWMTMAMSGDRPITA